jgi:hypothetical protein
VIDDDLWIFEIAVYRVSEDDWLDDIERCIEHRKATLRRDPDADEADLKHAESMERRPGWQYNEVVAWIRIKVDGDMLKAYSWRVPRQGFQRGFTPFPFEGGTESTLFELWRDDFEDSSEVTRGSEANSSPWSTEAAPTPAGISTFECSMRSVPTSTGWRSSDAPMFAIRLQMGALRLLP